MGANYNKVIVAGNLAWDVQLEFTKGGTAKLENCIATNDKYKNNKGEMVDKTDFVDVIFWGKTAEIVNEYLGKGSNILVEGRITKDNWEDKDGKKRSKTYVVADRMQMLGQGKGGGGSQQRQEQPVSAGAPQDDSDIPF